MIVAMTGLEYASARLAARIGARPDELDWHRLEIVRDYVALLDIARAMPPFGAWVAGLTSADDAHSVERSLRERWRDRVGEVAAWMPEPWQPAVRWCTTVVDLAPLAYLAVHGAALAWMAADRALEPLTAAGAPAAAGAVLARSATARLTVQVADGAALADAWVAEWRRRLPHRLRDGAIGTPLSLLARKLHEHQRAFLEPGRRDGWPLRRTLARELETLFQRALLDPAAAFVYLALAALDYERLRGELLRRVAFPHLAVSR